MRLIRLLCLLFQLGITVTGRCQVRDTRPYTMAHYTDEDGLPQNSVKSICRDELGYMWMSTENGLTRFDGTHFYVFDKSRVNGLLSNRINTLFRARRGTLYAITDKSECLAIRDGKVVLDTAATKDRRILPQELFNKGYSDYWTRGLPDLFLVWARIQRYFIPWGEGYIACTQDTVTFHHGDGREQRLPLKTESFSNYFLAEQRLYYIDKGNITAVNPEGTKRCTLVGDAELAGYEDIKIFWNAGSGDVLLQAGRRFYQLSVLSADILKAELLMVLPELNFGQISCCYYDDYNRRLFLGSLTRGLFVISAKQFRVLNDPARPTEDVYYAQLPYGPGAVLTGQRTIVGMDSNGVAYVRHSDRSSYDNFSMAAASAVKGFWMKNLNVLSLQRHELSQIGEWRLPDVISMLREDAQGQLWIGLREKGLYRMDRQRGDSAPVYVTNPGRISCLAETPQYLWIGTSDGLYCYGAEGLKRVDGMAGKRIRSLYVSDTDKLWITTDEDGMFLLSKGLRLTRFPTDRDNFLATAHCITEDRKGFFWITTNKGLFQVAKRDLLNYAAAKQREVYYFYYAKDNGFNTNEFNGGCQPCSAVLSDGRISLPSLDGLVWFDPETLRTELPSGRLLIDHIVLDNVLLSPSDTIELPRKFEQLQIQVSTPYLGNKRNVQISYALSRENGPVSWFNLGHDRLISFSAMPSGNYTLRIRKINGFGQNSYVEKVLLLKIAPRFYETYWFITLVTLLSIAGIFTYIRVRMLYVVKANRKLELRIAQRTRKLMNALRALESSESGLRRQTQIQEMLIAAISHDIKSPMKYLTLASEKMQKLLQRKDYESLPAFNQGIHDTAGKIYVLLDNLLQYISVQLKKGEIRITPVNLYDIINEKSATFNNIAALHFTTIQNDVVQNTIINSNRELLGVIVHNLIDNAVKNTLNGAIRIFAEKYNKGLMLVIEDNGKGIPQHLADWLNTPHPDQMAVNTASGHMGMGLVIVKELAGLISAKIFVERPERGGTRISITLLNQP